MRLTSMQFANLLRVVSTASPKLSTMASTEGSEKGVCAGVLLDAGELKRRFGEEGPSEQEQKVADRSVARNIFNGAPRDTVQGRKREGVQYPRRQLAECVERCWRALS